MRTPKTLPRVYLAGKIYANCWRHDIVKGLGRYGSDAWNPYTPPANWPVLAGGVLDGLADYAGPYFVGCDHGCAHNCSTHALTGDGCISDGGLDLLTARERSYKLRRGAMSRSSIVFAYIDRPDCFGTLVELGWASAQGKTIWLCFPDPAPSWVDDMWFVQQSATLVGHGDPTDVLRGMLTPLRLIESPAEQRFWDAHTRLRLPELAGLVPQHKVPPYRLDFAVPERKLAIEIDGYTYHGDKESFGRDRKRWRAIQEAGWQIVNFSGKEALDDPDQCVYEAARVTAGLGGAGV